MPHDAMAYVIFKIFMKQYTRSRFDGATAPTSTPSTLMMMPMMPVHLPALPWRPSTTITGPASHSANNTNNNNSSLPEATECAAPTTSHTQAPSTTPPPVLPPSQQISACSNAHNLAEVLVLNDTKIEAPPPMPPASSGGGDGGGGGSGSGEYKSKSRTANIAPIARVESEEDCSACCSHELEHKPIATDGMGAHMEHMENEVSNEQAAVRRHKSRVRNYLRKCRDRLTGQHQHAITITPASCAPVSGERELIELHEGDEEETCVQDTLAAVEEDPNCYEDIDFSLSHDVTMESLEIAAPQPVHEVPQADVESCSGSLVSEERLIYAMQTESGIDSLIDKHLEHIFPHYRESTRAILIRQARDLLVCSYHGCLEAFEEQFLCKFAKIAATLKHRHALGDSLIWRTGWPLTTPSGALILHLGCLDEALLRPADLYLCVKLLQTVDSSINVNANASTPQLFVVWRANNNSIQNRCIPYDTDISQQQQQQHHQQHLSALTIEMLSDELPQLLQNLLVGVERTITRISLNELQMPAAINHHHHHQQQQQQQQLSSQSQQQQHQHHSVNINNESNITRRINNNNNNNNNNMGNNNQTTVANNSPKCALKRSELITKNKMLNSNNNNNKYMLRRLTNRQDSMNSTSSGNSCGSSGSASSAELLCLNNNNNNNNNNHNINNNKSHNGNNNNNNNNNNNITDTLSKTPATSTSPALPLFCLGNSFPHIDSDEENADEKRNSLDADFSTDQFESEIIPPNSISEIPEKLLISGIELPGTRDLNGRPLITVDAESANAAGLNCYEIATVLLYYSTVIESSATNGGNCAPTEHPQSQSTTGMTIAAAAPTSESATTAATVKVTPSIGEAKNDAQPAFTILIAIEQSVQLCVVDLICQSLKLLRRHVAPCEILAICLDRNLLALCKNDSMTTSTTTAAAGTATTSKSTSASKTTTTCATDSVSDSKKQQQQQQQQQPKQSVRFISVDEVTTSVAVTQIPCGKLQGCHHHDARKWYEFYAQLEPFQVLCSAAGQRLVTAMSDIRSADLQGLPTRRQLYAQHRALSRALMDSELHNLRKRGKITLLRLQELAKAISNDNKNTATSSLNNHRIQMHSLTGCDNTDNTNNTSEISNFDVAIRLEKVTLVFNEVDRAAKRLEQLTEQRRERLRELTRQRALEDEIGEVTSWITSDGSETLQHFANVQLDCESAVKENEHEFEKYYFISMKHLAKGRDLHAAAEKMDALRESAVNLKSALDCFAEKLEQTRERIEGASRLHHLLNLQGDEECIQQEIQRLSEQLGISELLEKHKEQMTAVQQKQPIEQTTTATIITTTEQSTSECGIQAVHKVKPNSLNLSGMRTANANSHNSSNNSNKPYMPAHTLYSSTPAPKSTQQQRLSHRLSSGNGSSFEAQACHCWRESRNIEDMDEFLDGDEEEDGEEEQSKIADSGLGGCERCDGNPKLTRVCSCQSLNEATNIYDKSDELDDECFGRPSKPYLSVHSPIEANAHLQCHASSLELPMLEELSCLDPKIQKTLLLIIREMIGTERDYVRSLYYVIENYVDELLRDDIPQPLRGQRNVIFGNIEKIFEFHNSHFLSELERYERNPLKVGAAFLEMESKFYLYALYNKNKPKSDTLMSEYGTTFFKSKQFELNDKMDLASYLLKPVQRMGKYALLLQQLVKACNSVEGAALQEIAADVEELQRAEEMVKFQLRHGNDLLAMDSLRDCDVNVKEQGRLLRQNEFLVWQGRGGKKSLRQIFLFEGLVLFSKARRFPDHKNLDIYIYKHSIKTSDIGLTAHTGDSPTKFEIWFRKRKPDDTWTMQCMSEDIKNAWTEEISKLLWKQAKRNREIRLAEMSSMGIGSKPCLDIRPSNNQISDRSITITQLSKAPKLRHSFASSHSESSKTMRRPNSLISESSLSSGTSSSSLSTGSSSGHERLSKLNANNALELINETQALMLSSCASSQGSNGPNVANNTSTSNNNNNNNTNTLNSSCSGGNLRNHKRSTTLVSQLSMESGILSDFSMTPDQEHVDVAAWSATLSTAAGVTTPTGGAMPAYSFSTSTMPTIVMQRQKFHRHDLHKDLPAEVPIEGNNNPYLKDKDETVNL